MNEQALAFMRSLVPALRNVPDETLDAWLELAKLYICASKFGDDAYKALALYTLHIAFLDGALKQNGSLDDYGKKIASYSLSGEYSIRHESTSQTQSSMTATPWGRLYWNLLRKKGGGFGFITSAGRGCGCR
ncbi:hypothetical protein [Escherichia phage IMM-001]|nr:hypothetical protein [Escherichia phage IMM-001]